MTALPKSGRCFPNLFARITISSLIEVVGENGMHAVFRMAHLPELIESLPPANEIKEFDTADFSTIFQNLEEIFGYHGARGLAIRAGRMTFSEGLKQYGESFGSESLALRDVSVVERVERGLDGIANVFNQLTDQQVSAVRNTPGEGWTLSVTRCAVCEGRHASQPICAFTEGLVEEALFYFSGGSRFSIEETECIAQGAEACSYTISIPLPENPPFTV